MNTIPYSIRKILFVALTLFFLGVIIFFLFFMSQRNTPPPNTIIVPTPLDRQTQEQKIKETFIIGNTVKNIHWVSGKELSYTLFDLNKKRVVVEKTDAKSFNLFLDPEEIRIPSFFWSNKESLLILDSRDPNQTYLFSENNLTNLNLKGFTYSWLSDGDSFFYGEQNENTVEGKIYDTTSKTSTTVSSNLPIFASSIASPTKSEVLLFNYSPDGNNTKLYLLNLEAKNFSEITKNTVSHPLFSPDGEFITFFHDNGLYLYHDGKEELLYPFTNRPPYVSYNWIADDEILIFDSSLPTPALIKISLPSRQKRQVFTYIDFQRNQNAEIQISPDGKTIAIAAEKDGLWFIPNTE